VAYSNRCAFPLFYPRPTTWHVSGEGNDANLGADWSCPLRTIQRAVDLAGNGDRIVVSNGVYADGGMRRATNTHITRAYIYRRVTVESLAGPAYTVIAGAPDPVTGSDGTNAARCAFVTNGATLIGFTLSNGYVALGPFYYDRSGSAVLLWQGGLVSNCHVVHNRGRAAAVSCDEGGTILACVVSNNLGTGIALDGTKSIASNCVVVANHSRSSAGGVFVYEATIVDCFVGWNTATNVGDGGGIHANNMNAPAWVERCNVVSNYADGGGGGIYADGEDVHVRSCLVVGNSARYSAGGIYLLNDAAIENCTVVANQAGDHSGGVYIRWHGTNINTIIRGNVAPTNSEYGVDAFGATMWHCSTVPDANALPGCHGNITNTPEFVAAGAGDYRLVPGSPCIDRGTNLTWMAGATDLDGNARIDPLTSTADIGCYETALPEPAIAGSVFVVGYSLWVVWKKRT
jgi:predicted outer membrane repeat protein